MVFFGWICILPLNPRQNTSSPSLFKSYVEFLVHIGTLIQLPDWLITSTRNFPVSPIEIIVFSTIHPPFEKWRKPVSLSDLEKEMVGSTLCGPLHEWIHASMAAAVDSQVKHSGDARTKLLPFPAVPPGSLQPTYSWWNKIKPFIPTPKSCQSSLLQSPYLNPSSQKWYCWYLNFNRYCPQKKENGSFNILHGFAKNLWFFKCKLKRILISFKSTAH